MRGSRAASAGRRDVRLSALVVNYNSGAFCASCVDSLRAAWAYEGRRPEDLEVVVVDNASPLTQEPWLADLEERGVTVVRSTSNAGYAGGMNLALARTSGGPRDVVAVLNPDLFFLPGALGLLLDYLEEHDDCGVLGPRAYIDDDAVLHLPRNELPTLYESLSILLAQTSPSLCRSYSERRLAASLPWWQTGEAVDTEMVSGCCMLLRREVVARLPSLMDERYPLYFEDTDLCREVRRLGYRVVFHGGASVVHHWSRSCGIGGSEAGPLARWRVSQRAYFRKFYGPLGGLASDFMQWCSAKWPPRLSFRPMHPIVELGTFEGPVVIPLPRRTRFVLELTMAPSWILAVAIFGEGASWTCPARTWEWFFQADYYIRAVDLANGEVLGAWHFAKTSPGRNEPLEVAAIPAYRAAIRDREGAA